MRHLDDGPHASLASVVMPSKLPRRLDTIALLRLPDVRATVAFGTANASGENFMTYVERGLLAVALMLIGLAFWPLLAVGALIALSVYTDIRDARNSKYRQRKSRLASRKRLRLMECAGVVSPLQRKPF